MTERKRRSQKALGFKKGAVLLLCFLLLFSSVSCKSQKSGPVTEVSSREEQAEICGFSPLPVSFPDFSIFAYRTVYGIVAETEYTAGSEKHAVLRMADAGYTITDLSGFADTGLEDVYTHTDGREFEIETRDGVYAVEWRDEYGGKEYLFSLTLFGGELVEMRQMLRGVLDACTAENEKEGA